MSSNIKPTRSELIKLKKSIKLAVSGHKLLKKKRDGLILDFFEILKEAKDIREEIVKLYVKALEKINIARMMESDVRIKSMAMAIKEKPEFKIKTKNIMGVVVPKIEAKEIKKHFPERGYGVYHSPSIDEAAYAYEELLEKILKAAEIETSMKKLLREIENTKRRVNALEFKVIPEKQEIQKFITLRLEEMERETVFRMKRIKA